MTLNIEFYSKGESQAPYVRITQPGEGHANTIDRPASPTDRQNHQRQWEQFQRGLEQTPAGEPIETLFGTHQAICNKMHFNGIHVLEQLAILSGNAIDALGMGSQLWVNKAQEWLKKNNAAVGQRQYNQDMSAIKDSIKSLEEKIGMLLKEKSNGKRKKSNQ